MEITDHRGKKITEGTTLKYLGTRTRGKADKICFRESNTWIRLDTTGLYYRLDYLMVINPERRKNPKEYPKKRRSSRNSIKHPIKPMIYPEIQTEQESVEDNVFKDKNRLNVLG